MGVTGAACPNRVLAPMRCPITSLTTFINHELTVEARVSPERPSPFICLLIHSINIPECHLLGII